jgi:hypothetical protein
MFATLRSATPAGPSGYFSSDADANSEPNRRAGPTCEYGGGRERQRRNPLAGRPMRACVRELLAAARAQKPNARMRVRAIARISLSMILTWLVAFNPFDNRDFLAKNTIL